MRSRSVVRICCGRPRALGLHPSPSPGIWPLRTRPPKNRPLKNRLPRSGEEPAALESAPGEAATDEPPTEELTLAELAGPAVGGQAAEQLATAAEPATAGTVYVTFTLPGEVGAGHVALCGDFNNWTAGNIALNRGGDGSWQTTVPLEPGHSYRYRYLLDGERWENAWQADRYEPNPFGSTNSVVIVGSPELALMS